MDEQTARTGGWKLSSTTSGAHLQRALEMYEELGIEVSLEEINPKECGECMLCYTDSSEPVYRIYTRQKTDIVDSNIA
jgi:hypothetical protein